MSNMSCIGFPCDTVDDAKHYAEMAVERGEVVPSRNGQYIRWQLDGGPAIWTQIDISGDLFDMNPFFKGGSRNTVRFMKRVDRHSSPLDGCIIVEVDSEEEVEFPVAFEPPCYDCYRHLCKDDPLELQLTGFAQYLALNPNYHPEVLEGLEKKSPTETPRHLHPNGTVNIANQAFFHEGLYDFESGSLVEKEQPKGHARISGFVSNIREQVNPVTRCRYYTFQLETMCDLVIDVVCDPEDLINGLKDGDCVLGYFWLTGIFSGITAKLSQEEINNRLFQFEILKQRLAVYKAEMGDPPKDISTHPPQSQGLLGTVKKLFGK